jgi:glycosyltransferase involved in cell wall biosynthesis
MKKVLFITYFWPPSGKASLHWPLKMIKYLPDSGWQPYVLTVTEDTFTQKDESLLKEIDKNLSVIKTKSFEPFDIYKKFTGKAKDEQLIASETISRTNKSLAHRISIWIRMNLFIPDARIGWFFSAVLAGNNLLKKEKFDAIISVGPPHTSHVIGMRISKRNRIPLIPVFIDPWVDIAYYREFKRSRLTLAIDHYLEKSVMGNAASIIFVTRTMKDGYTNKYDFIKAKSEVLYWGYNEEDFNKVELKNRASDGDLIVHAGNIFDFQNPKNFWKMLKEEIENGRKLRIKFIGTVSPGIKEEIGKNCLMPYTEYVGFLPYDQLLNELSLATYLLVCATEKRHVPGKLFEYMRTGKPIIAFGDDNEEVKSILAESNAGMIFNYNESGKELFEKTPQLRTNLAAVEKFDRKNIAKELANILSKVPGKD